MDVIDTGWKMQRRISLLSSLTHIYSISFKKLWAFLCNFPLIFFSTYPSRFTQRNSFISLHSNLTVGLRFISNDVSISLDSSALWRTFSYSKFWALCAKSLHSVAHQSGTLFGMNEKSIWEAGTICTFAFTNEFHWLYILPINRTRHPIINAYYNWISRANIPLT